MVEEDGTGTTKYVYGNELICAKVYEKSLEELKNDSASPNRYAYVQGNPVSLTDPFGLSPDMDYGNYEANALKKLFTVANKAADYLPVVGTARDIQRSYNAFKNKNIGEGIKNAVSAAVALAGPAAKAIGKAASTVSKVTKAAKALKAEKCVTKTAQIASEGIKLAGNNSWLGKLATKTGDVSKKIAKSVKNGVSTVARTVKTNAAKVYKKENRSIGNGSSNILQSGARNIEGLSVDKLLALDDEAAELYELIRKTSDDVSKIAGNTSIPEWKIHRIKSHVFYHEHILRDRIGRFDPDIEIADAWKRLESGNYNQNDLDLLEHEYFESKFESFYKTDYITAHNKAIESGRVWNPYKEVN